MSITSINYNYAAYNAASNIQYNSGLLNNNVAALSSGSRIVSASTDVAALAAGVGLQTQVSNLNSALSVASQGSSLLQVADGGLAQIQSILQRQQSITTSSQSGTLSAAQRGFLDQEFQALTAQIDSIASTTNFNGVNLLNGAIAGSSALYSTAGSNTVALSGLTAQTDFTTATFTDTTSGTTSDTSFAGTLAGGTFNIQKNASNDFVISYTLNGVTYSGALSTADAAATATKAVTLTSSIGASSTTTGSKITITKAANNISAFTATQVSTELNALFASAQATSTRTVRTSDATDPTTGAYIKGSSIANVANGTTQQSENIALGTILAGFDGSKVSLQTRAITVGVPTINSFSALTSGTGAISQLSVVVNGQSYSTALYAAGNTALSTTQFGSDTAGHAVFYLNGNTSSNEKLDLNFTSVVGLNLTTSTGVNSLTAQLNSLFGSTNGSLSFQVGSSSAASIGVSLASATSSSLFGAVSQNVTTLANSTTAQTAVGTALSTVTSLRATVGALAERFNFATSASQSAQQNQSAAASNLLDTDVANESTAYATNSVKVQAGISVLAQAKAQAQNLLKLLQ